MEVKLNDAEVLALIDRAESQTDRARAQSAEDARPQPQLIRRPHAE
ncbi:hypothetical protein JYT86_00340 [bacterium AH-315-N03]|nr:hypothetical protein [bacterium AH-315-N03]